MNKAAEPSLPQVEALLKDARVASWANATRLGEGWDCWVFRAGPFVLRVPQSRVAAGKLRREFNILRALEPLDLPVPRPIEYVESGFNDLPCVVFSYIEGVPMHSYSGGLSIDFARSIRRTVEGLQAFPADAALAVGLPLIDGKGVRQQAIHDLSDFGGRVFPHLAPDDQAWCKSVYHRYIEDERQFQFTPRLCHGDMADRNLIVNREDLSLAGVIDFGDAHVGDPLLDYTWAYAGGFERYGIESQLAGLGLHEEDILKLSQRTDFVWLTQVMINTSHALALGKDDLIARGLEQISIRSRG